MSVEFIQAFPLVKLGRDLFPDVTYDTDLVRFRGEWSPEEPEGWEVFTVKLHGQEAGDWADATINDLRSILAALDTKGI